MLFVGTILIYVVRVYETAEISNEILRNLGNIENGTFQM